MTQPDPKTRGITRVWSPRDADPRGGDLVSRVLHARGIDGGESSTRFLNPPLSGLHDPSAIPDLDRAAERILSAIKTDEPIVIFGDYDVDGVTSTAILVHLIRTIAPETEIRTYIPHRVEEGYGLNSDAIRSLAEDGARVIVSVDCGITAIEPALVAKQLGVDLIITDHHNPPTKREQMPDAFAIVHPRRPDSTYPFGELCGAGVAYKLAWRLATMHAGGDRATPKARAVLLDLLAFAALGTIADIVPLVDENRVIVKHGLRRILHVENEGLHALIHASGLDSEKVDAEDVGFRLAPRLNAVGRIGDARESLELLTNAKGDEAVGLANRLTQINEDRRSQEQKILTQALEMVRTHGMDAPDKRAIVLVSEDWHPGIVGIVCSRLVERFARPAILMCKDGKTCKGSGRSIDGFNLHAGLENCSSTLLSFGGHDMAAGMSCDAERFGEFRDAFVTRANKMLAPEDLVHAVRFDTIAQIGELSTQSIAQLERLAPFGAGNPKVRIRLRNLKINGQVEQFGKTGNHLSMRVSDVSGGPMVRIIGWNWWRHASKFPRGARIEAVVEPNISRWNGNTRIEPLLIDARVVLENGDEPYSVVVTDANASALN